MIVVFFRLLALIGIGVPNRDGYGFSAEEMSGNNKYVVS